MTAFVVAVAFALVIGLLLVRGAPHDATRRIAVAAALLGGLGGYALTGRPTLPAAPAAVPNLDSGSVAAFETERQRRLTRFGSTGAWLAFADTMLRIGASHTAVVALRQEIAEHPDDAELWIGLGNALAMHGGHVGPAARLAFARAATLDPASPDPAFFEGLAELETGDARGAAARWQALRARSLPDPDLDARIAEAQRRAG